MLYSGTELINPFKVLERAGLCVGWHVADLGCGSLGHFVFPAAQMVGASGKVYAVDILKIVVHAIERKAKAEQYSNVYPIWSDIDVVHAARIPEESLDLTLIVNNLFLSQNRSGLVKEAMRLTKPGGRIIVVEWKKDQLLIGPPEHNRMTSDEVEATFHRQDVLVSDRFDAGEYHFAILFRKTETPFHLDEVFHR